MCWSRAPGQPELAAAAGPARGVQVGVEQLLRALDRAPEEGGGGDPGQRRLVGDLVLVTAAVDQVGGPGGAHLGVVERLEHRLHLLGQVLGVHPVDGVGQRAQHAELPGRREARAVLDVAALLAVVPVHARDLVPVGTDAGGDRGRAHRGDRREGGHAVADVDALLAGCGPSPARGRRRSTRSSIAGFIASTTTSTSFLGALGLTSRSAEDSQAGVLLLAAAPAGDRAATAAAPARPRPPAAAAPTAPRPAARPTSANSGSIAGRLLRPAARARAPAADGWPSSPTAGADHAADQPGPHRVVTLGQRARRTAARR